VVRHRLQDQRRFGIQLEGDGMLRPDRDAQRRLVLDERHIEGLRIDGDQGEACFVDGEPELVAGVDRQARL